MGSVIWDLRYSLRSLARHPGFTAVVVIVLALGIGANTAIFTVIDSVLLKPLPYPDPGRLVKAWGRFTGIGIPDDRNWISVPEFKDFERLNRSFSGLAAMSGASFNVSAGGTPERVDGAAVSASMFPMLGVKPEIGRLFTREEETPGRDRVVLISHGLWQRRFAKDPGLIGRTMRVNGVPYQVIGVLPAWFNFPADTEIWGPLAFSAEDLSQNARGGHGLQVLARIKPELSLAQAKADAEVMTTSIIEQSPGYPYKRFNFAVLLSPLLDEVVGDVRKPLWVLMAAVGAVLLIACANVAGLLLARATAREREIAIRVALGAGQRTLIRQLLTESLILGTASGLAGIVLAAVGLRMLKGMAESSFPRVAAASLDGSALVFAVVLSLITGLVFGLAPAWQAARSVTYDVLKEGGRGSSAGARSQRFRRALVVAEVALSLMLLVGAGLLIRSFLQLQRTDPGFRPDNVLTMRFSLPDETYGKEDMQRAFYRELLDRVTKLPGVESAGGISILPLSGSDSSGTTTIDTNAVPADQRSPECDRRVVLPGYFESMGIKVVRGRTIDTRDTDKSAPVAVVDETLASKYWPGENVVGKRLKLGGLESKAPWMTVAGVVAHVRNRTLEALSRPTVYMAHAQNPSEAMSLTVRTAMDPSALSSSVQRVAQGLDPDQPMYKVRTMNQLMAESIARRRLATTLLGVFAGCALLLAAIGLYGVMAYAVTQRTHEIGIRVALGASRGQVIRMVLGQSLGITGAGIGIGFVGAIGVARAVSNMLFGVRPGDPVTFALVAAGLALVALAASYIPAWRASVVDPAISLRNE
jgi:putative ABC transport system permease protein